MSNTDGGAAEHGARTSHSIVPEDFDLASARSKRSTTPDDERPRCPYCNSVNIESKTGHYFGSVHRQEGKYRCDARGCGRHFDKPVRGDGDE